MKIEQIYTECLTQGAYYITSNGFKGIEANGNIPLTNYQCPTSMSQEVIDEALAAVA